MKPWGHHSRDEFLVLKRIRSPRPIPCGPSSSGLMETSTHPSSFGVRDALAHMGYLPLLYARSTHGIRVSQPAACTVVHLRAPAWPRPARAESAGSLTWHVLALFADELRRERRLARTVRASGVLEERHQTLPPGVQDRLGDLPGLFGLVGPDEECGVALQKVEEKTFVGGEELLGGEVGVKFYLLQVEGVVGAVDVQVQDYLIWLQPDTEHVGPGDARPLEREVGHRLEVNGDLAPETGQGLAPTQHERHPRPPQIVDREGDLGEGLGLSGRVHALLGGVGRDLPFPDRARAVAGTHGLALRLLGGEAPDGPQDVHLAVAQVSPMQGCGRLHRGQAQELEEVVLDQVLEGPGVVEVAGPALQRQGLLPDDLDAFYEGAVPERLEDAVCEAQTHDRGERLPGEEVVDAEDGLLREKPVQQPVEPLGRLEVFPEGLLYGDPAPLRQI